MALLPHIALTASINAPPALRSGHLSHSGQRDAFATFSDILVPHSPNCKDPPSTGPKDELPVFDGDFLTRRSLCPRGS
jgi:hypothetical protein